MKRLIIFMVSIALSAGLSRASAADAAFDGLPQTAAGILDVVPAAPVPDASGPAAAELPAGGASAAREWLVLVFVNGRNNLAQAAVEDVNEMELAGSSDRVAVTVELGLLDDRGDSTRLYIARDAAGSSDIVSPSVKVPGADMGSWKHFVDFAKWSYRKYPAKKVLVVVWNHGSGRIDIGGANNAGAELGIAYDDLTHNFIRNRELAAALGEIGKAIGRKVDVYASDACLMQMAEVAYEMKDQVRVIVGSEETIPGSGFPYDAILSALNSDPAMGAEALGSVIVKSFAGSYSGSTESTTLSAIRSSALPGFAGLLNDWVRAAAVPANREAVYRAWDEALSFENGYNGNDTTYNARSKDLADFVTLADKYAGDAALRGRGEVLKKYIAGKLMIAGEATPSDSEYGRAGGVAAYFPKLIYDSSYDENLFSRDSLWDDFLKWKLDPSYKVN